MGKWWRCISMVALLVMFSACSDKPIIEGFLSDVNVSSGKYMAYLVEPESLEDVAGPFRGIVRDSSEVDQKGKVSFHWSPENGREALLEVVLQEKGEKYPLRLNNDSPMESNYMPVIYSGKKISFQSTSSAFLLDFNITNPSRPNTSLLQLRDIRVRAFQRFLEGRKWDIHVGTGLLEKEESYLNYQKELIRYADTTLHFLPAMVALRWVSPQMDYERVPEFLFQQCEKWMGEENLWKQHLCQLSDREQLPVLAGDLFPMVSLPLLSGEVQELRNLMGASLTLIDLWASWCVPCRKENRETLVPLWEKYHDKGFEIVAYGLETNAGAWKAAIDKDGAYRWVHTSHLQGDEASLMKQLRIRTIPANFIIDSEGRILAKNLHGNILDTFVENYFNDK